MSKSPRYFFKRLLLFLSFVFASFLLANFIFASDFFRNKIPNILNLSSAYTLDAFKQLRKPENRDILFLGSSHAEFEPAEFGKEQIKAQNFAIPSLRPVNAYYFLKGEIKNIPDKVVALETYFDLINEESFNREAILKIIANDEMSLNYAEMALNSKDFATINSAISICFYHLLHPLKKMEEEIPDTMQTDVQVNESNPKLREKSKEVKPYTAIITRTGLTYLQQSIDIIKNSGKTPMLIMSPVTQAWKNNCINYGAISSSLDSLAGINKLVFLNYNEPENYNRLGISNSDFYDVNHLTHAGRLKFSKVVAEDLKKLNLF